MNSFDLTIQQFVTSHAFRSVAANHMVSEMVGLYLVKGLFLVTALWWIWFQSIPESQKRREIVVATLISGLLSLVIGRLLAHFLPFRLRPYFEPALHLHFPAMAPDDIVVRTWSSFPSDHAMLWTAVATGIFLVWRFAGVIALLYTAVFICAPRVYVGLHYPTDVLAGAFLGFLITLVMCLPLTRQVCARPILRLFQKYPGPCYAASFLFTFELVTQFDEIRIIAHLATHFSG